MFSIKAISSNPSRFCILLKTLKLPHCYLKVQAFRPVSLHALLYPVRYLFPYFIPNFFKAWYKYISLQEMRIPTLRVLTNCISISKQCWQNSFAQQKSNKNKLYQTSNWRQMNLFLLILTALIDIFYTFAPAYISCKEIVRFAQQFKDFIPP